MNAKTKPLSPAQQRIYDELQTSGKSLRPGGHSRAGIEAAAWTRSGQKLVDLGLAEWRCDYSGYGISFLVPKAP